MQQASPQLLRPTQSAETGESGIHVLRDRPKKLGFVPGWGVSLAAEVLRQDSQREDPEGVFASILGSAHLSASSGSALLSGGSLLVNSRCK